MPDIVDRLDRLSRLRADGALTEEEFQEQKAQLLTAQPRRNFWLIASLVGAAIVGLIALVYALSAARSGSPAADEQLVNAQTGNFAMPEPQSTAPETSEPKEGGYDWATSELIIGMNPDYVQSKLGPPRSKNGKVWSYEVEGCAVSYTVESDQITAFDAFVGGSCRPQVSGRRLTDATTFGDVEGDYGSAYGADCLSMCGNAYDPPTYLIQQGPHSNGYIDHIYSSYDYEASEAWTASLLKAKNLTEDGAPDDVYACATNPPSEAVAILRAYKISSVQVGRNLAERWCGRSS